MFVLCYPEYNHFTWLLNVAEEGLEPSASWL